MIRGLPVLFVLAAGCDSPFGDSPFGLAVTDGEVDAALECADLLNSWCLDQDSDGYGAKSGAHPPPDACDFYGDALRQDSTTSSICFPQDESDNSCDIDSYYVNNCSDCDDRRSDVNTGSTECASPGDKQDNDCDGLVDEDHADVVWYKDYDGDGFGDPLLENSITVSSCAGNQPYYVRDEPDMKMDCNDTNDTIHPGADEVRCGDGIDHNCDDDPGDCALYQAVDVSRSGFNGLSFVGATASVAWYGLGTDESTYFAVGYPGSVDVNGEVEIYLGGDAGPTLIATLTGDKSSGFGSAMAAGDFDRDGAVDLAVSAPTLGYGEVFTYFGVSYGSSIVSFSLNFSSVSELGASVVGLDSPSYVLATVYTNYDFTSKVYSDYVWMRSDARASAAECAEEDVCFGGFKTDTDWPLALASATFGKFTYVGVGASDGVSGDDPGIAVYDLTESGNALTTADLTLTGEAGKSSALGASLAFGTLSNGTSLVLVGDPETRSVYLLEGVLTGKFNIYDTSSTDLYKAPYWISTNDSTGSAVALIGDVDSDEDEELAIGGNGVLWIIAQQDSTFPGGDGDLDSTDPPIASGKITGFEGIVRHIVNAGDVNGDGYSDLLISTDTTTYLLYGGYKPAQEDASGTAN